VVVVTKDTNLRIKADALGITAEDYESDRVDIEELYRGFREVNVGKEFIDAFYAAGECLPPPDARDLHPNEYIIFRDAASQSSALGRFDGLRRKLRLLAPAKDNVWGGRPRNTEQTFALDILLDDSVKLVTLAGKAGTGKTLLAIGPAYGKPRTRRCTSGCSFPVPSSRWGRTSGSSRETWRKSSSPGCSRSSTTWNTCSDPTGRSGRAACADTRS